MSLNIITADAKLAGVNVVDGDGETINVLNANGKTINVLTVDKGEFPLYSDGDVLFNDTFNDTDGVLLGDHTPDIDPFSAGWTASGSATFFPSGAEITPTQQIQDNELVLGSSDFVLTNASIPEYTLKIGRLGSISLTTIICINIPVDGPFSAFSQFHHKFIVSANGWGWSVADTIAPETILGGGSISTGITALDHIITVIKEAASCSLYINDTLLKTVATPIGFNAANTRVGLLSVLSKPVNSITIIAGAMTP